MFSKRRQEQLCSRLRNQIITDVAPFCKISQRKRGDASRRNGWPQCNAFSIHHGKPSPKCSPLFSLYFPNLVCIQGVRCNFGGSPLASCRGGQPVESGEKRAKDEIEKRSFNCKNGQRPGRDDCVY